MGQPNAMSVETMSLRNRFGLLLLSLGCAGILGLCWGTTDTVRIAGPINFTYLDDLWYVGFAIAILGLVIWFAMRLLNRWATTVGIACLMTGIAVFSLMLVRLGNLSTDVVNASGGQFGPAHPGTYGACALPAALLLMVGYWKAAHCRSES